MAYSSNEQVSYMSEEEANDLIKKYDKDGDSILTKDELTAMILEQAAKQHGAHKEIVIKHPKEPAKVPKQKDNLHDILQKPLSAKEADDVFKLRDTKRDGVLDRKELMADSRASKVCLTRDEIRDVFLDHDIDGDGFLNCGEVIKALTSLGVMSAMMKANYGMKLADADGDNLISEDELEKLIDYFEKTNKKSLKRKP